MEIKKYLIISTLSATKIKDKNKTIAIVEAEADNLKGAVSNMLKSEAGMVFNIYKKIEYEINEK